MFLSLLSLQVKPKTDSFTTFGSGHMGQDNEKMRVLGSLMRSYLAFPWVEGTLCLLPQFLEGRGKT